jgi:hypothetical protein
MYEPVLLLTIVGVMKLRSLRLDGFVWLRRSVVVSLLVQPVAFLLKEFGTLGGLALDILLWLGMRRLIQ